MHSGCIALSPDAGSPPFSSVQQICPRCQVPTDLFDAQKEGDLVCSECGTVLESHCVEESSEWRTFSESDKAHRGSDPNRVGGPTNHLLSGGGQAAGVAKGKGGEALAASLARTQGRQGDPDKVLLVAFGSIGSICSNLQLPNNVKDAACEVFKMVLDNKVAKGTRGPALHAACVLIACRQEDVQRNFREVCGGAPGTTQRDIGRAFSKIVDAMVELKTTMNTVGVKDEAACGRLASSLALPAEFSRAGREIAKGVRRLLEEEISGFDTKTRKQPLTVAAVSLYLALTLHGGAPTSLADVSRASSMASETIDSAARWLFPYVRELCATCATEFRREEAIQRIEARYPKVVVDMADQLRALVRSCVAASELHPPTGLQEKQRPLVEEAAAAMAGVMLQAQWQQKHNVGAAMATVKPRSLAAALVWLALRLAPAPQLAATPMRCVIAAGGIAQPSELRAAARVAFPRARELANSTPGTMFKAEEAISAVEKDTARLLWLGDSPSLARAIAAHVMHAAAASDPTLATSVASGASALAPALHTAVAQLRLQEVPRDALDPSVAAAAAWLSARLVTAGAVVVTADEVARAAGVDTMAVLAVAQASFTQARVLAHSLLTNHFVSEDSVAAVEAEYPPPYGVAHPDGLPDGGQDDMDGDDDAAPGGFADLL